MNIIMLHCIVMLRSVFQRDRSLLNVVRNFTARVHVSEILYRITEVLRKSSLEIVNFNLLLLDINIFSQSSRKAVFYS